MLLIDVHALCVTSLAPGGRPRWKLAAQLGLRLVFFDDIQIALGCLRNKINDVEYAKQCESLEFYTRLRLWIFKSVAKCLNFGHQLGVNRHRWVAFTVCASDGFWTFLKGKVSFADGRWCVYCWLRIAAFELWTLEGENRLFQIQNK